MSSNAVFALEAVNQAVEVREEVVVEGCSEPADHSSESSEGPLGSDDALNQADPGAVHSDSFLVDSNGLPSRLLQDVRQPEPLHAGEHGGDHEVNLTELAVSVCEVHVFHHAVVGQCEFQKLVRVPELVIFQEAEGVVCGVLNIVNANGARRRIRHGRGAVEKPNDVELGLVDILFQSRVEERVVSQMLSSALDVEHEVHRSHLRFHEVVDCVRNDWA